MPRGVYARKAKAKEASVERKQKMRVDYATLFAAKSTEYAKLEEENMRLKRIIDRLLDSID